MLFSAFIFGFLAATLALTIELILIAPASFPETTALSWSVGSVAILILIALIEETCKYLFLLQHRLRSITDPASPTTHPFVLGILFGLGFAALEITLAYYNTDVPYRGSGLAGIVFLHVVTSLTLILLMNRFAHQNVNRLLTPLIIASVIHLLYNGLLTFGLP